MLFLSTSVFLIVSACQSISFPVLADYDRTVTFDAKRYGLSGSVIPSKEDWCSFPDMGWS